MTNYYRLTKKELSFLSDIEAPLVSSALKSRLSCPIVLVYYNDAVLHVWTLKWYRYCVNHCAVNPNYRYVIRSMY